MKPSIDLFHYRILLLPIFLFGILFGIDKIFYLKPVKDRTLLYKKVEPLHYESRLDLLQQLIDQAPHYAKENKKIGIILGSSRSAEFDSKEIEKVIQNTVTYNFSVPMGGIAHAYYYAHLLKKHGIQPSFFMVEADFVNFGNPSLSFALQYDFDPGFVLSNTNFLDPDNKETGGFRPDETDTFFLKYLFALYRYPVDPANIVANYKPFTGVAGKTNLYFRELNEQQIQFSIKEHFGGIPNPLKIIASDEALAKDAAMVKDRVMGDGRPSTTQILLFNRLLDHAEKNKITLLVYKPVVSHQFEAIIESTQPSFQHNNIENKIQNRHNVIYVNPEEARPLDCRAFVDALHLSGQCYGELTEKVFSPYLRYRSNLNTGNPLITGSHIGYNNN